MNIKTLIAEAFGILFIPVCLLGQYFTGYAGFLTAFNVVSTIAALLSGSVLAMLLYLGLSSDPKHQGVLRTFGNGTMKAIQPWRLYVSRTYWVLGTVYLMHINAFYGGALLVLVAIMSTCTVMICRKQEASFKAEEEKS